MNEKVAKTPRPHMLDADEVAELLRIKKGSAYEVIRKINAEQEARVREHTWITKEYIINDKLVSFFGGMRMCDVRPIDVIRWQNELTEHQGADGKPLGADVPAHGK